MTELTQQYLKSIIEYNPEYGTFVWRFRTDVDHEWNKRWAGKRAGSKHICGYYRVCINARAYLGHRLAWLYMMGEWPENEIDHIDGVRPNNKFSNLRKATKPQNSNNRGKNSNNTSGYKGVTFNKNANKWMAQTIKNGKRIYLGLFESPQLAHQVYCKAIKELNGEFARAV